MQDQNYPEKKCPKVYLLSCLAVFIFLFVAGYLVNHVWLMPIYNETSGLWRPMGDMQNFFGLLIAYYAMLSLTISALFCKIKKSRKLICDANPALADEYKLGRKHCPLKCGMCFGITIGMLLGAVNASTYIWMPIPANLAIDWFAAWLIEGICIGLILSIPCIKKCNKPVV